MNRRQKNKLLRNMKHMTMDVLYFEFRGSSSPISEAPQSHNCLTTRHSYVNRHLQISCLLSGATRSESMLFFVCLFSFLGSVSPHGRLVDPPARSCMWRYGFNTPKNYDDNALFCGGRAKQWEELNGKCGVCGDAYDDPKPSNVDGGPFATGTIAGHYGQGEVIQVQVEVTANHGGYFEFRLCPLKGLMRDATQECLDRNQLLLLGDKKDWTIPTKVSTNYTMSVQLPPDVTCRRCVLQWKWVTANSWGCDKNTECCIGCGPQENFVNCADIRIGGSPPSRPPPTSRPADPVTNIGRTVLPARPQTQTLTASRSGYQVPKYSIGVQPERPSQGYDQQTVTGPRQNTGYTSYYPASSRPISGSGRPSARTMSSRPTAPNTNGESNVRPASNRQPATSYAGSDYSGNGRSRSYPSIRPTISQPQQASPQRNYNTARLSGGRARNSDKPKSSHSPKRKSRRCRLKFQVPGFNMNCRNLCKHVKGNCVSRQRIPVIDSACTLMCRYV